jgi:DsbC/DsbD-like thiol-disulfide interchange protein
MVGHVRARGKITAMFALASGLIALGPTGCTGGRGASRTDTTAAAGKPGDTAAAEPGGDLVALSLVADSAAVLPGGTLILAARFDIDPGWHIYWENPGEAGLATEARFTTPAGFTVGTVRYPGPTDFTAPGPVQSFGYAGYVLLSAPVLVPASIAGKTASFTVDGSWLACREECVRGSGTAELTLPVAAMGSAPAPANQDLINAHAARLPQPLPATASHSWTTGAEGPVLLLELPTRQTRDARLVFFPSTADQLAVTGQEQTGAALRVRYRGSPARARGVLGAGEVFYLIDLPGPLAGPAAGPAAEPAVGPAAGTAAGTAAGNEPAGTTLP